jgi:hypothetical protein
MSGRSNRKTASMTPEAPTSSHGPPIQPPMVNAMPYVVIRAGDAFEGQVERSVARYGPSPMKKCGAGWRRNGAESCRSNAPVVREPMTEPPTAPEPGHCGFGEPLLVFCQLFLIPTPALGQNENISPMGMAYPMRGVTPRSSLVTDAEQPGGVAGYVLEGACKMPPGRATGLG